MARVTYDKEADILYVLYKHGRDAHSLFLTGGRTLELASTGEVVGVEFADASKGVDFSGVPVDATSILPELTKHKLTAKGAINRIAKGIADQPEVVSGSTTPMERHEPVVVQVPQYVASG